MNICLAPCEKILLLRRAFLLTKIQSMSLSKAPVERLTQSISLLQLQLYADCDVITSPKYLIHLRNNQGWNWKAIARASRLSSSRFNLQLRPFCYLSLPRFCRNCGLKPNRNMLVNRTQSTPTSLHFQETKRPRVRSEWDIIKKTWASLFQPHTKKCIGEANRCELPLKGCSSAEKGFSAVP